MIENIHKPVENADANGQECLGTLKPRRSNAFERMLENVHIYASKNERNTVAFTNFTSNMEGSVVLNCGQN